MNPASKISLPAAVDPVVAAIMEQLQQKVEAKDRVIAAKDQALAAAEAIIQQLKEALRLERIQKYGNQSEKLTDLQLDLLDHEPGVSSEEIESEAAAGPLPEPEPRSLLLRVTGLLALADRIFRKNVEYRISVQPDPLHATGERTLGYRLCFGGVNHLPARRGSEKRAISCQLTSCAS